MISSVRRIGRTLQDFDFVSYSISKVKGLKHGLLLFLILQYNIKEAMLMKVKSRMSCPVRRKDGTWTTIIKEFEEDIPDLGREELICNKCGRPDYPKCKETVCKAWIYHKAKKRAED